MATTANQLAEVNIALARKPLDAPLLAEFMAALDPGNASTDQASGLGVTYANRGWRCN